MTPKRSESIDYAWAPRYSIAPTDTVPKDLSDEGQLVPASTRPARRQATA